MKHLLLIITLFVLPGCSSVPTREPLLAAQAKFRIQSCLKVYYDRTEDSVVKNGALRIAEALAAARGITLDLKQGLGTEYYAKRELSSGYVYSLKSAKDVCNDNKPKELHEENLINTG